MPIHPLPDVKALNNYWKIDTVIRHCIRHGYSKFIISPFGELGLMVKQILNIQYSINEVAIIDDIKEGTSPLVTSFSKFEKKHLHNDAILLLAAYPPLSKDYYYKLIEQFNPDLIVSIFDSQLTPLSATGTSLYTQVPCLPHHIQKTINDNNTITISFVGDLILLENMVKNALVMEDHYEFSKMFYYTKKHFQNSDLNIGVLEGPVAPSKEYSKGNFSDGKPVFLNYPVQFIKDIKEAGINLVTTCNNHSMDRGIEGLSETIDNLESINLDYVGTYRDPTHSKTQKIISVKGLTIGVIAYTYGFNTISNESFTKNYPYAAKLLCSPHSIEFEDYKNKITTEIQDLKKKCDLVIVLPHMGKDFTHNVSDYEKTWANVFRNAGADLILACHAHSIKPIELEKTLIAYCPGNYVNSFIDHDGDLSIIAQVYLNKEGKLLGCAIIPMVGITSIDSVCYPIPIYDLKKSPLYTSSHYSKRSREASIISSTSTFGITVSEDIYSFTDRLYLVNNVVYRSQLPPITTLSSSFFIKMIDSHNNLCFIGDSITAGSNNGGIPWYEPLPLDDKRVMNISWGGITAKQMAEKKIPQLPDALYIIAIGCNDIRYHNNNCCLNESEYLINMKKLIDKLEGEIILLSPWPSTDTDPYSFFDPDTKHVMYMKFNEKLRELAKLPRIHYLHTYDKIVNCLKTHNKNKILVDHIHPNTAGIYEYCRIIMKTDL